MPKEKNYNPVQDHKKAEKQKQIRKQKATLQNQRNEKLARRNPNRIQRDIDDLKTLEQNGTIRPHERQRLQELEKDLAAVNKARAALGDKAPVFKPERRFEERSDRGGRIGGRGGGVLGKRTRDGQRKDEDSSDTDADVERIPMPRDTPPPIPRKYQQRQTETGEEVTAAAEPKKPTIVYEAAPQVRDLKKEATKFMPASVAQKMKLAKGEGRLLEPEEFDKLQDEGYMRNRKTDKPTGNERETETNEELEAFLKLQSMPAAEIAAHVVEAAVQEAEYSMMAAEANGDLHDIASEAAVAENNLRHVEMEEVEDEDL